MMRNLALAVLTAGLVSAGCARSLPQGTFASPEEAVQSLMTSVKAGDLNALVALFGEEGRTLVASSDAATGRRNQAVFLAAAGEQWRLEDRGPDTKELIVGNEDWPFPIPLVRVPEGWRFDAAAGAEEVLDRRIGRNELAAIETCRAYVAAQHAYAREGHDGKPAGVYARRFNSETGRHNGLYWPAVRGEARSPLGDLVAGASQDGYDLASRQSPSPFNGYLFRILTAQGAAAKGGARDYLEGTELTGGFGLIAWPATYDATGVMTFIVNGDGEVFEKDLGADTATAANAITVYDPDATWRSANTGAPKP